MLQVINGMVALLYAGHASLESNIANRNNASNIQDYCVESNTANRNNASNIQDY